MQHRNIAESTSDVSIEESSPFLQACRLAHCDFTPIWLMRQAGRFMPEYRKIREKMTFLELCKTPSVAAEVTVMAVEKLGVDAAIIFADILLVVDAFGVGLSFAQGDGPVIERSISTEEDINRLLAIDIKEALHYVFEAIRIARNSLKSNIPLLGFAGAPFTLASYLIEGGASRNFEKTKKFMYCQPRAWHQLMSKLTEATITYLNLQIDSDVQAIQLFDSWVGCLSPDHYQRYALPYTQSIISAISKRVPVIHFGVGTAGLLKLMQQARSQVIGLDWRVNLKETWLALGPEQAIQGNLDPMILLASQEVIEESVKSLLHSVAGRNGHIFNLGHGVLPETPVENVRFLVDLVHELSIK